MSRAARWTLVLILGFVVLVAVVVVPRLLKQAANELGDPAYPYWVLNDSDATVVLDVRADINETLLVPPHTYGPVTSPRSIEPGWTISLVDQVCRPMVMQTIDTDHDLAYISSQGQFSLVASEASGYAWGYGLGTATGATLSRRNPSCSDAAASAAPTS